MTIWNTPLDESAENYLIEHSQLNNSIIDFVFRSANEFDEPHMQISQLQALQLQFFIKSNNVKKIIEVGTFVGFSAFAMALSLPKSTELNEVKITSIEINKLFHEQAKINQQVVSRMSTKEGEKFGAISDIDLVHGDAKDVLNNPYGGTDLLFLDGDKENYPFYLKWASENLSKGSLFIVDNILFKGGVMNPSNEYSKSIRKMTEQLKSENNFDFCFVPSGDCMLVAVRK